MKKYNQYLFLEGKRIFKKLPGILLGSILLLFFLAGSIFFCQSVTNTTENEKKFQVAIVAEPEEPFVDFMVSTLQKMKNIKYTLEFKRMSEKEAIQRFNNQKTAIIFFIPKNYIKSIFYGENKTIRIRFTRGQKTIVSFLMQQLCTAASSYILDTEAGIYSLQDYYKEHNLPGESSAELELNFKYIHGIASLNKALKFEEVEVDDSYSPATTYLLSGIVLFLLLWGITFGTLLTSESNAFRNQLSLSGITLSKQLFAKCIVFFGVNLLLYLGLFGILSLAKAYAPTNTFLPFDSYADLWLFALQFSPILLFSCSLIHCIFSWTKDALGGSIFLFGFTILSGLISGCFYPFSYLPDTLQIIAGKLPLYHGLHYGLEMTKGRFSTISFAFILGYSICFFGFTYLAEYLRKEHSA